MSGHDRNPGYVPGTHWLTCDRCGFDYKQEEMQLTWDGLMVCVPDWEPRNEQEFLRPVADVTTPAGEIRGVPVSIFTNVTTGYIPPVPPGTF